MQTLVDIANDPEAFLKELVDRKINKYERTNIMAMIIYRAHQLKMSHLILESYAASQFGEGILENIKARQFGDVVDFLVDFKGVN